MYRFPPSWSSILDLLSTDFRVKKKACRMILNKTAHCPNSRYFPDTILQVCIELNTSFHIGGAKFLGRLRALRGQEIR
jgi:hypothetical protein